MGAVVNEEWTYPENKTVEDLQGRWEGTGKGRKYRQGPLRAGVVMQVRTHEGEEVTVLIGDVNELMGTCDDCWDIHHSDVVIRYKKVWRP